MRAALRLTVNCWQLPILSNTSEWRFTTSPTGRLATYAIAGEPGSGVICINGAAAHLVDVGHLVIIASYADYDESELRQHQPRVILVDHHNRRSSEAVPADERLSVCPD